MRRAARVDGNHSQMIDAFRSLGCSVLSLAAMGNGVPDLLVAIQGNTWLVEVKMPKGKQTADQVEFAKHWQGKMAIARNIEEAQSIVAQMKTKDEKCIPRILLKY